MRFSIMYNCVWGTIMKSTTVYWGDQLGTIPDGRKQYAGREKEGEREREERASAEQQCKLADSSSSTEQQRKFSVRAYVLPCCVSWSQKTMQSACVLLCCVSWSQKTMQQALVGSPVAHRAPVRGVRLSVYLIEYMCAFVRVFD